MRTPRISIRITAIDPDGEELDFYDTGSIDVELRADGDQLSEVQFHCGIVIALRELADFMERRLSTAAT